MERRQQINQDSLRTFPGVIKYSLCICVVVTVCNKVNAQYAITFWSFDSWYRLEGSIASNEPITTHTHTHNIKKAQQNSCQHASFSLSSTNHTPDAVKNGDDDREEALRTQRPLNIRKFSPSSAYKITKFCFFVYTKNDCDKDKPFHVMTPQRHDGSLVPVKRK